MKWNHIWCHNGTVNLTIKNIPDDVYKVVKRTAAERGRSLNAEVIQMLQELAENERRRKRMLDSWEKDEQLIAKMPKIRRGVIERIIREDREGH